MPFFSSGKERQTKMKRPVIGITCNFLPDLPDTVKSGIAALGQSWELVAQDYVGAVERAGGIPVILPVHADFSRNAELLSRLDGVIVSGGHDVSPMLYGQRFDAKCGLLDTPRDAYELALTRRAMSLDLPYLGICRGIQIFNVAHGGTLYQDLPSAGFQPHSIWSGDRRNATHAVRFPDGSPLAKIFGSDEIWVNSFHHQAIKVLAPALKAAAISAGDGLIEGAYRPDKTFALAVQWHPEMMPGNAVQEKIFAAFIAACS